MRIKHQLTIFNALTRFLIILAIWLSLPILIEKVVYKRIDKTLLEKKEKFIEHLDKEEINDFLSRNDATETFASFSTLHNEFLQLYQAKEIPKNKNSYFKNEARIIEGEQSDYRVLYYDFVYENTNYKLEIGSSLSEIKDLTLAIRVFILIVLSIVIVFTFLVDAVFIEYLLKPFHQIINQKIRHVNEPEKFNYTVIKSHSTDFRELDEVLNQMMKRIQELFSIEKQFIANVSHELLSPIALLKNRFENLIQNESLDEEAVNKIVSSLKTLDLLKKIINNLLLISRIENNQYVSDERIDCRSVLEDIREELQDRIDEKEIDFSINLNEHYHFAGNKTLIHIMFYNVIANAVKFTEPKGTITITDVKTNSQYAITVQDNGCGMTQEQTAEIFNRFTRLNINKEGQGLGLAIVKSIADFHQIDVVVTAAPQKGSAFEFVFHIGKKV
ncbi:HAMP domain-containing histidine kinase [Flavobacterium silvisoli]|uniref:histidine kinase n=1 Tax=Flavobacterium silvisoli TaxID=2529433 RepID=A0A4Q9Z664_9FLAO|nr:HAMP domain-containing sensor histidine kinase [Flavobacterium silvisoli]TBX70966.1 HAMP domain-containing histidine kinase [Flavobacterium silvisoli]